jgi:N-acetylmuramoyl-L-alanine amidase
MSSDGQQQMAESITRSIKRYKDLVEKPVVQNAADTKRK